MWAPVTCPPLPLTSYSLLFPSGPRCHSRAWLPATPPVPQPYRSSGKGEGPGLVRTAAGRAPGSDGTRLRVPLTSGRDARLTHTSAPQITHRHRQRLSRQQPAAPPTPGTATPAFRVNGSRSLIGQLRRI